ncbi:DUF1127 domain-containing protein [Agrobacterium larrymoorei]|uniref:Uncharacterized protein YjiS (DUF1127 family) n=1 Tax=Agrobacterium larrymoorei TaxID=160699 RepID=A0ABU0UE27_9HYPH|nr:DUF1127 domain-containing protein [Agrobacterium larrymoorei]MDQ1183195.1 uncharacterized protein YjiS (DUF1127 family) [Agrobacterium larrymoorei]
MRRMEEYLAIAEQGGIESEVTTFVRDRMTPAKPFAPIEAPSFFTRVFRRMSFWHVKRQSRLSLYDLSPEQLVDIGLSRAEADQESRKALLSSWTRSL